MKVRDFLPKNQCDIYFVTSKQDCLGIVKLKNVFRSTINPSTKMIWNLKKNPIKQNFLLTKIDWLTYFTYFTYLQYLLMPSDKRTL